MRFSDPLTEHFRLTPPQKSALLKLGLRTVRDLLFHLPSRYDHGGSGSTIAALEPGAETTVIGTLEKLETKKSWKRRVPVSEGRISDTTGSIKAMWFNQPYIAKMWAAGSYVKATGKVAGTAGKLYLANPHLERAASAEQGLFLTAPATEDTPLFAIYSESRGITSLWMRHAIAKLLAAGILTDIVDPIPADVLKHYSLPSLQTALVWVHTPKRESDAAAARKRFSFEEVFMIQLARAQERHKENGERSFPVAVSKQSLEEFIAAFPFTATPAQMRAIHTILDDMQTGRPMSRLLEGDVGSGKTAVAAAAAWATIQTRPQGSSVGRLQVAYMAPTEILAKQHFESFIAYFEHAPVPVGLITGSGCYKFPSKVARGKATPISRAQLLKWVANGEIPIVIGTHALIQKSVHFKHLALVVIDEQHRFGMNQRRALTRKEDRLPHLLSMTATPIPRTLALTLYGDLDLTLLDQMPPGRKPVITEIVSTTGRSTMYEKVRAELRAGRQAYVICPRIDEPDPEKAFALQAKSVKAEAKRLKKEIFPEYTFEVLHSKMSAKEKDAVMARFAGHEADILVATSVVEVGVNVPNATVIILEGAERFGLSQLHQLRGRVVRSNHQAYCYALPESRGERTVERLKALKTAKNGFELAELDLMQRGPGELSGRQQWGISDIGMEALKNLKLVEAARAEAQAIIAHDPLLAKHESLRTALGARSQTMHFE